MRIAAAFSGTTRLTFPKILTLTEGSSFFYQIRVKDVSSDYAVTTGMLQNHTAIEYQNSGFLDDLPPAGLTPGTAYRRGGAGWDPPSLLEPALFRR